MTKDEALQMCLEYIETDAHERRHVRWAIKKALAAPVQERNFCERCGKRLNGGIHTCTPPAAPVQEPVGRISSNRVGLLRQEVMLYCDEHLPIGTAVYTRPQPTAQRKWIGLTQQDIDIAFDDTQEGGGFVEFACAIEQRLKEKNT